MVELFDEGTEGLLLGGRDAEDARLVIEIDGRERIFLVVAGEKFVEELARRDELDAVIPPLFAVLLLLLLLVGLGGSLVRVVEGVDLVAETFGDLLHRRVRTGGRDRLGEDEGGIMHRLQEAERLVGLLRESGKFHDVVGDDLVADLPLFGIVDEDMDGADARVLNGLRLFLGDNVALESEHFTRLGVEDIFRDAASGETVGTSPGRSRL